MAWALSIGGVIAALALFFSKRTGEASVVSNADPRLAARDVAELRRRLVDLLPRARTGQASTRELTRAVLDASRFGLARIANELDMYKERVEKGAYPVVLQERVARALSPSPPDALDLEQFARALVNAGFPATAAVVRDVKETGQPMTAVAGAAFIDHGRTLRVRGSIRDQRGRGVNGVVHVLRGGHLVGRARTTVGSFSLYDLPPGDYVLRFRDERRRAEQRLRLGRGEAVVILAARPS